MEIMGGEGAMMNMIHSLRNNKNLLAKRKDKKGLTGSYSNLKLAEFPNATPKEIQRIREKIQRENRQIRKKQILAVTILICVALIVIISIT